MKKGIYLILLLLGISSFADENPRFVFDDISKIKNADEDYIINAKPAGDKVVVYKKAKVLDNKASKKDKASAGAKEKLFDIEMQVYYPNGKKPEVALPCVVLFSGGAWSFVNTPQFSLVARMLADLEMVAINANYRSRKTMGKDDPSMCVEDAKSAVRYVREHAEELGVNPNMLAVGGCSAGGHIAVATACLDGFNSPDDNLEISCVPNLLILFNPVMNNAKEGFGYNRIKHIFPQISPSHNLKDNMPPSIIFVGEEDIISKPFVCQDYKAFLDSKGIYAELYTYEGQGHSCFNHYKGKKYFVDSLEKTVAFLQKYKYLN